MRYSSQYLSQTSDPYIILRTSKSVNSRIVCIKETSIEALKLWKGRSGIACRNSETFHLRSFFSEKLSALPPKGLEQLYWHQEEYFSGWNRLCRRSWIEKRKKCTHHKNLVRRQRSSIRREASHKIPTDHFADFELPNLLMTFLNNIKWAILLILRLFNCKRAGRNPSFHQKTRLEDFFNPIQGLCRTSIGILCDWA